jgi:DNA-binding MarR family transcriptional regulator
MQAGTTSKKRAALLVELDSAMRENGAQTVHFSEAIADRLGIHPTDLETLDLLYRRGPLAAGEIADATGLRTASVTALIDRLDAHGFARRVRDSADRRKVHVEIDRERADREIAPLYSHLAGAMAELLREYSDSELVLIRDLLRRGYELMREETLRLREP